MDADGVLSLARRLQKYRSTSELSFTAVSLLSKTLTARATRLESSASRARLAADREARRRIIVANRRRGRSAKSSSEFMRQTIQGREQSQENNRVTSDRRAAVMPQYAEPTAMCRSGALDKPSQPGGSSGFRDILPFEGRTHSYHSNRAAPTSEGDTVPSQTYASKIDYLDLEKDNDIRVLLSRIRAASTPRPVLSCGKPSVKTRPMSGHTFRRPLATLKTPPLKGKPPSARREGIMTRPQSAGGNGWTRSNPSDNIRLRRDMLIRSHGEAYNLHLFPNELFEVTAMGRKAYSIDREKETEVAPWIPAATLRSLERLDRSRTLMNQRPVVSKKGLWAR